MYKDMTKINSYNTGVAAIKNSIKNIILTRRGSLPGKPRFGSDLYKIIFSQMDILAEDLAKQYIEESLSEFEDRIIVMDISFKSVPEYNKMIINIVFNYKDNLTEEWVSDDTNISVGI